MSTEQILDLTDPQMGLHVKQVQVILYFKQIKAYHKSQQWPESP